MITLGHYLKPYSKRIALGTVIKIVGTITELFLPWILSYMIDEVAPEKNVARIFLWGAVMLACAVVALLGNITANRMASKVARDTTESMRFDLFDKTLNLSARQTDGFAMPSLVSRLSSDTYNVHNMIGMIQRLGIRAPMLLIGGIVVTFMVEPVLALVLLATMPFLVLLAVLVAKKGTSLYTKLQKTVDTMVRKIRDIYSGIRVIKALSRTEYEKKSFETINKNVSSSETRAGLTTGVTNPIMNLFLNLGMTAVILVGAYRVSAGLTKAGQIIAFMTYFTLMLNAVISVGRIFVMYSKGIASSRRICEVLNAPADLLTEEIDLEGSSEADSDRAQIRFEHVSFSYDGGKVLDDVSFSIGKGETFGIIGATGSGKTTIIMLMMRFYDADEGNIYIDGRDIRTFDKKELRRRFGVVFQNDFLFSDTVRNNVDFHRGISDGELEKALKFAQADFVFGNDEGLNYGLAAKGANFSGGQKQRLLVARALSGEKDVIVLDDSSSALDYKTDAALRKALKENFSDRTIIMIAQRISSVRHADKILVLDDGKAAGLGSDEELRESCPLYGEILRSQGGCSDE
ncbi:MAG TPA: ABC transporter ATP-binding protein [Clostridiales bacterium]|jgi:ABC transporter, permease/ATP-binding protein|nr:MAG: ABC transporter ATP-binding protein [Subdoligranulum sp.]HCW81702.1 ABC transporter ATP-binding protein [Clostridiales bacterium]